MRRTLTAFLLLFIPAVSLAASVPPASVLNIVEAAKKAGLLVDSDFSNKTLSGDQLFRLKKEISRSGWIAEIPNLEATLLDNYPSVVGVDKVSGFRLAIHYSGDQIMLLSCNVPVVNGGEKEATEMVETMLTTAEALLGANTGVRSWLDAAWKKSWELSCKEGVDRKEVLRTKQIGAFLVTVWGVPPDIIFLNCVRKAK